METLRMLLLLGTSEGLLPALSGVGGLPPLNSPGAGGRAPNR